MEDILKAGLHAHAPVLPEISKRSRDDDDVVQVVWG